MALLSVLKKPEAPLTPHRDALAAHMAAMAAVNAKRQTLSERDSAAQRDREAGSASAAKVAMLSAAVDQSTADLRYGGAANGDLATLQAQLQQAERDHAKLAGVARAAAIASAKYAADGAELSREQQALSANTAQLLYAALLEEQLARRERYEAAKRAMITTWHETLAPAFAADELARQHRWEIRGGSALFSELNIPVPPQFEQTYGDDTASQIERGRQIEAAHQQHREQWQATKAAGAALAQRLLGGKDE